MTAPVARPVEPGDETLVTAALSGDLYAWEVLVRRYQEPVFRLCYLIVRSTDLADPATQTTFIRAYRALPSFDDEAALLPWLFRIAAGESRQQRRESGRPRPSSRPVEAPDGPKMPASAVAGMGLAENLTPVKRTAIADAFDRLGEDDRLTLAMRYLFGLDRDDAAAAMSLSTALIDEHLTSAMQHLRQRLADA